MCKWKVLSKHAQELQSDSSLWSVMIAQYSRLVYLEIITLAITNPSKTRPMQNNPKQTVHNMYSLNVLAFGGEDTVKNNLKISN